MVCHSLRIPDKVTCLLRNLYAAQEATVRTLCGTMDWFKIGKGVCQDCILSYILLIYKTAYLTYMQNTREMVSWMKHKLESRLLEKIMASGPITSWKIA